ncbi:putative Glycosyltransferase family 2 protein [Seiridium unicorne]|uniref:Glycosyltransferase family 2 protein n=1 Tax=Seiridium unicorne TaxID=138068 RepID=A0ABR2UVK1_9PEZI
MVTQNANIRRNPSITIPPSLLANQWSHRHGQEEYQQRTDFVASPSEYISEDPAPFQYGKGNKRARKGPPEEQIALQPQPHSKIPPMPTGGYPTGNNSAFGGYVQDPPYPQAQPQSGLYTIYDHHSAGDLSEETYGDLGARPVLPPGPPDAPYDRQEDDVALLRNNRRPPQKKKSLVTSQVQSVQSAVQDAAGAVSRVVRRSSTWKARREALRDMHGYAKIRKEDLERRTFVQFLFQVAFYLVLGSIIYFVFVGIPLWNGATYYMYQLLSRVLVLKYGFTIFVGIAFIYAFLPLLIFFEKYPKSALPLDDPWVKQTALIIPCYKSAGLIENTIRAAIRIFPTRNIFVIANGNSPEPLDNTADIVAPFGVNHVWSPVGSKIVAQFVGAYAAEEFKYVLLIDDDCALPPNFPVVSDRIKGKVKCLGYTIKSVGPDSSRGTLCQQAQDLEYKLSGLQRAMAGKMGSCTFAHGAIALWDRQFLIQTFHEHPGFSVSEDWFFGHVARKLGSRITMCTSVFVETETPSAVFFSSGGSRGGFGEMTIWKQRFFRWNFFFVNGIFYDLGYILFSWKLGFWEIGAKLFVWQEIYETLLYIFAPFVLPMSFMINPVFTAIMMGGTTIMYLINAIIFNEIHLRLKKERVTWACIIYYIWYKFVLTFVNILSCYWSIFKYAQYFAIRHPKVIEDEKALAVVLNLDQPVEEPSEPRQDTTTPQSNAQPGTRPNNPPSAQYPRRGMSIRAELAYVPAPYRPNYETYWNNAGREV